MPGVAWNHHCRSLRFSSRRRAVTGSVAGPAFCPSPSVLGGLRPLSGAGEEGNSVVLTTLDS
jgi:hypothetical protein